MIAVWQIRVLLDYMEVNSIKRFLCSFVVCLMRLSSQQISIQLFDSHIVCLSVCECKPNILMLLFFFSFTFNFFAFIFIFLLLIFTLPFFRFHFFHFRSFFFFFFFFLSHIIGKSLQDNCGYGCTGNSK